MTCSDDVTGLLADLHSSIVYFDSIQLGRCLHGAVRFVEDDRYDAATLSVRAVSEHGPLYGADRLCEIFL